MRSEKLVPLLRHEAEDALPDRTIHIAVEPRADDDSLIHRVLTNAVYQQRRQLPGLRALFWREEYMEIKKALQDGTMDLGIFLHSEPTAGESLDSAILCEDEMVLVLRSQTAFQDDRGAVLETLHKRGVILLEKEPRGLAQILSILDAIGSAPQVRFCQDRTAILPQAIARRLQADDLHILHFQHPAAKLYLLASWRRECPSPLTRQIAQRALAALRTK